MISERATDAIDDIFRRAARSRLVFDDGDRFEFVPMRQRDLSAADDQDFVVLTISAIGFRMLTMIHIDDNEATRAYFSRGASDAAFMDILFEAANLFCGAINQELLQHFPELGMSTPYYLGGRCTAYLAELKPAYVTSYAIAVDTAVCVTVRVCVCAHAPLDFINADPVALQATGELELF